MGFMDMFSNIMNGQDGNGGIVGGISQIKNLQKEVEENRKRPKPGKYCGKACRINDERCKACLEVQARFEQSLHQVEKLEDALNLSSDQIQELSTTKKIKKCTLCGAPFEKGVNECPYCGTPYPDGALDIEIPLSKSERNEQLMKKVEDTWNIYAEKESLVHEYSKSLPGSALGEMMLKFATATTGETYESLLVQNASELKKGAEHYNVSISEYLHGIAMGEMLTPKNIYYEEQRKILNEQSQQRQAAFAAQQAQRQTSSSPAMDFLTRHAQYSSPPQYGNVPKSSCCGNCRYYLMGSNECGENKFRHPKGASDYCGSYRSM